jgi:hypothetical protein
LLWVGKQTPFGELLAQLVANLEQAQALVAELAAAELMHALPERSKDETDIAARRVPCPACKARAGNPCSWAASHTTPSYVAHASRRALVKPSRP